VKSKDYSDRVKKEQAYDVLVTKVETVDKDENRDTVVLVLQYFINCTACPWNYFAQYLRGHYSCKLKIFVSPTRGQQS
jgi:hypothetical protein